MAMPVIAFLLLGAVFAGALFWFIANRSLGRGIRGPRVVIHPAWRWRLSQWGMTEADAITALGGVHVTGHRDRHVLRTHLGPADGICAFLKIESRVRLGQRWKAWRDGLGFSSLSQREARLLHCLERENLPGPGWIAFGKDSAGKHFLMVAEKLAATEMGLFLVEERNGWRRRRAAIKLGRALARLHAAGFSHPDLYAKHILVDLDTGEPTLLDWQRTRRVVGLGRKARLRDLAALHATVSEGHSSFRERQLLLRAYLREARRRAGCLWGGFGMVCRESYDPGEFTREERRWLMRPDLEAQAGEWITTQGTRLLRRRHIREKCSGSVVGLGLDWIPLDGEDMLVTSSWPPSVSRSGEPQRCRLDQAVSQASHQQGAFISEVELGGGRLGTVCGRVARTWGLEGTLWRSTQRHEASLYNQLRRHAVPGPQVLAVGRSTLAPGRITSYVMLELGAKASPLRQWLTGSATDKKRVLRVLAETGRVLARLHGAGCRLAANGTGLAVRLEGLPRPRAPLASTTLREVVLLPGGVRRAWVSWLGRQGEVSRLCREIERTGIGRDGLAVLRLAYSEELAHSRRAGIFSSNKSSGTTEIHPLVMSGAGYSGGGMMEMDEQGGPPPRYRALPSYGKGWLQAWRQGRVQGVERADWARLAGPGWVDRIMDANLTDRFHAKQGRSIARWTLPDTTTGRDLVVYVKRHHKLPWLHGLLAWLTPGGKWSPALQEWQHLEWARRQGVPVPEAVAAAEFHGPGTRLSSCLVVEELTGMLPLHEAIPMAASQMGESGFRDMKRGLAREMARLSRLLHDRFCFHKDLYLCHFYINERDIQNPPADWRGRVVMIDLHRLARHRFTGWIWQVKDLAQLLYSSEVTGVTPRDRLEFWRAYRTLGAPQWSLGVVGKLVRAKHRRYSEHNRKLKLRHGQTAHPGQPGAGGQKKDQAA